jgi:tetratricopeptide (TPR) repeat protein
MLRVALACLLVGVVHASAQLPAIPSFELPASEPGFTSVRELRVAGTKRLDTDVKVRGYVIWIYDCLTDVAKRGESRAKTQKRIDSDPTICERKKLYLGDSKDASRDKALWVVDVPRPPNKLERERLPKAELKAWPKVPTLKVGQYVTVTGKFALRSPHSEANSDGLVVFAAIEPAKPALPMAPASVAPKARPAIVEPQTKQRTMPDVSDAARQRSVKASNEGARLSVNKFYGEALRAFESAIKEWPGNHVAYYGLAVVHIQNTDWRSAREAIEMALAIEPRKGIYNMMLGHILYEASVVEARAAQAKQQGKSPDQIRVDTSAIHSDNALGYLTYATKLDPQLWRAYYDIGRIYRDRGEPRWSAEALDEAVRNAPNEASPWIALVELYRRWDYTDEAIAAAIAGTAELPNAPDLWLVRGLAHDDKLQYTDAIAAYTKVLELQPDNAKALFARGQAYAHKRDRKRAKADLEAYLKSTDDPYAHRLLMGIQ